jgi:hypothetical protein
MVRASAAVQRCRGLLFTVDGNRGKGKRRMCNPKRFPILSLFLLGFPEYIRAAGHWRDSCGAESAVLGLHLVRGRAVGAGLGTRPAVRTLGGDQGAGGACARASPCPRSCGRRWPSAMGSASAGALEAPADRGAADRLGRGRRHPAGGADLGRRPGRGRCMRSSFTLSAVVRSARASAPGRRCGPWAATRARAVHAPELHLVRGRAVGAGPRRWARRRRVRSKPRRVVVLPTGSGAGVGTRPAVRTLGGDQGAGGACARASPCPRSCGRRWPSAMGSASAGALEAPAGRGAADRLGRGRRHPVGGADLGRRPGRGRCMRPSFTLSAVVRSALALGEGLGVGGCARSPGGSWCCRQARARASAPGRRCGPWAATRARAVHAPELHLVRGRAVGAGPRRWARRRRVRSKPRRVVVLPTGSGAGGGTRPAVRTLGGDQGAGGACARASPCPRSCGRRGRRHPAGGADLGRRPGRGRCMRPSFTLSAVVRSVLALGDGLGVGGCARSPGGSWCCRQARARAVRTLGGDQGAGGACARTSPCPRSCGRRWPSATGRRCGPWAATRATGAQRVDAPELHLVQGRCCPSAMGDGRWAGRGRPGRVAPPLPLPPPRPPPPLYTRSTGKILKTSKACSLMG